MKINKQNKMNKKMLNQYDDSAKPIIEMKENETMPLYMFIAATRCPFLMNTELSFMCTALHLKKENLIEVRGRMRYEATGKKTAFEMKEKFKMTELLEAKGKIQEMYNKICEEMKLEEISKPFEMEFMQNESMDEIMEKMNNSNMFNIGQKEKI